MWLLVFSATMLERQFPYGLQGLQVARDPSLQPKPIEISNFCLLHQRQNYESAIM